MLELIIRFIMAVIATEAITEIAVKSELFEPVRKWLFESKHGVLNFVHRIFDCGYCFSVWAALLMMLMIFIVNHKLVDFFIIVIVIHRLSNIFHFMIDRLNVNRD